MKKRSLMKPKEKLKIRDYMKKIWLQFNQVIKEINIDKTLSFLTLFIYINIIDKKAGATANRLTRA